MPFLELSIDIGREDSGAFEEACFASGALSVTLADAADDPVLEPAPGATPLWPSVRLSALFPGDTDAAALVATLSGRTGLAAGRLELRPLPDRAWEREWLRDFHPMQFGRRLWISPGGQRVGDPEAVVLELDPGLAFGTGSHPTTALCLQWLDGLDLAGQRVLDYGCGSGILALAALRLGAAAAVAMDVDDQALIATRENAERNGLAGPLRVLRAEALGEDCRFDVVLANILAGPLTELAPRLASATASSGRIVLAGMLDDQAESVASAYRPCFHMTTYATRGGWTALTGLKRTE